MTRSSEHLHEWANQPEHAMTVAASHIREGPEASGFGVLMVPVEYERGTQGQASARNGTGAALKSGVGGNAGTGVRGDKYEGRSRDQEKSGAEEVRWPRQQGSRYRVLLISGAIAWCLDLRGLGVIRISSTRATGVARSLPGRAPDRPRTREARRAGRGLLPASRRRRRRPGQATAASAPPE